ncbi:hypothetical protein AB0M02_25360 [Actinoplanes sp. NPDC051861]|uniref:hypothetical protein n=1 Tax=Actinoplanes sp. NPDC051861 TaxID=3155170 RepID=UPI0034260A1A
MTTPDPESHPSWLTWPIRAIAIVVVLPFRLLWEAVKLVGRFLERFVLAPLAWLWRVLVVIPVSWLAGVIWTGLRAVGGWVLVALRVLIGVPAVWLWRQVVLPVLRWVYRWVLRPVVVAVLVAASFVVERMIVPAAVFVYEWALRPAGRAVVWFLRAGWEGTAWLGRQVYRFLVRPVGIGLVWIYRYLLRPVGVALGWAWRYTFGALFRGVVIVWRATVMPASRWVRDEIWRPGAAAARSVLVAVGLRR